MAGIPLRKPAAAFSVVFSALVTLFCLAKGQDIPPGVRGLLESMLWVSVGGYMGSSTAEAVGGRWVSSWRQDGGVVQTMEAPAREETGGGV